LLREEVLMCNPDTEAGALARKSHKTRWRVAVGLFFAAACACRPATAGAPQTRQSVTSEGITLTVTAPAKLVSGGENVVSMELVNQTGEDLFTVSYTPRDNARGTLVIVMREVAGDWVRTGLMSAPSNGSSFRQETVWPKGEQFTIAHDLTCIHDLSVPGKYKLQAAWAGYKRTAPQVPIRLRVPDFELEAVSFTPTMLRTPQTRPSATDAGVTVSATVPTKMVCGTENLIAIEIHNGTEEDIIPEGTVDGQPGVSVQLESLGVDGKWGEHGRTAWGRLLREPVRAAPVPVPLGPGQRTTAFLNLTQIYDLARPDWYRLRVTWHGESVTTHRSIDIELPATQVALESPADAPK
jgi:hypothetical protein